MSLLDVNVLVALAWPNHVHHGSAQRWFVERGDGPWATTPITEAGFVRVSSNAAAIPTAVPPVAAIDLLAAMRAVRGHAFLPDDVELLTGERRPDPTRLVGHRQVTDAHLLAIARQHGARLATFDRGVASLTDEEADVEVVPVV